MPMGNTPRSQIQAVPTPYPPNTTDKCVGLRMCKQHKGRAEEASNDSFEVDNVAFGEGCTLQ